MTLSAKRAALLALICLGVEFGSARNLPAQSNSWSYIRRRAVAPARRQTHC